MSQEPETEVLASRRGRTCPPKVRAGVACEAPGAGTNRRERARKEAAFPEIFMFPPRNGSPDSPRRSVSSGDDRRSLAEEKPRVCGKSHFPGLCYLPSPAYTAWPSGVWARGAGGGARRLRGWSAPGGPSTATPSPGTPGSRECRSRTPTGAREGARSWRRGLQLESTERRRKQLHRKNIDFRPASFCILQHSHRPFLSSGRAFRAPSRRCV